MQNIEILTKNNKTRILLICGVISGISFIISSLIQAFTRPGFDIAKHAISLLQLGSLGWIQILTFELTGLLAILYAIGLKRALSSGKGSTWTPILVGIYGISFIIAGLFHPDPTMGFPPGTANVMTTTVSWHAGLHELSFFAIVITTIAGSLVIARRFALVKLKGWAMYNRVTACIVLLLLILGIVLTPSGRGGLPLLGVGFITSVWISLVAWKLLRQKTV